MWDTSIAPFHIIYNRYNFRIKIIYFKHLTSYNIHIIRLLYMYIYHRYSLVVSNTYRHFLYILAIWGSLYWGCYGNMGVVTKNVKTNKKNLYNKIIICLFLIVMWHINLHFSKKPHQKSTTDIKIQYNDFNKLLLNYLAIVCRFLRR